jgi:NAD(P)H-dependent flavin oxidoreductase YrpB (nitropropane dioxygenase family)
MFLHIIKPFIANAPMYGVANAALAAAVTKAGGLGSLIAPFQNR